MPFLYATTDARVPYVCCLCAWDKLQINPLMGANDTRTQQTRPNGYRMVRATTESHATTGQDDTDNGTA